ncbi:MAG: penicillin-binding protein 2 [Myxococcota bacterium]
MRIQIARWVLLLTFAVLWLRLFTLQLVRGQTYLQRSENNFIQEQWIPHARGRVTDANGEPLVDNRPSYDVYVTFALLPDTSHLLRRLLAPLKWDAPRLRRTMTRIQAAVDARQDVLVPIDTLISPVRCRALQARALAQGVRGWLQQWHGDGSCDITVAALRFPTRERVWRQLQRILGLEDEPMEQLVARANKRANGLGRFKPVLFLADVDFDAYARIQGAVSLGALSGVSVVTAHKRRYLHGDLAAHVLGFVNEVSLDQLRRSPHVYRVGHKVGRGGIERSYEEDLRGQDGIERFVVDARGRRLGEDWQRTLLGRERFVRSATSGLDVQLAIDARLQRAVQQAFTEKAGAAVALDPGTGYVLALASFPSYNPNHVVGRGNTRRLQALRADPLKPWINRAIGSHYPPGSAFKPVTALAGLREGVVTTQRRRWCPGQFRLSRTTWRCVRRHGHGWVDFYEALRASCDVYFYHLGHELGLDPLARMARELSFGKPTGIDLFGESGGNVPTTAYYRKRLGYDAPGFVVNSAIGQGDVTVTTLQLATAYAALVNGGTVYRPRLVRAVSRDGRVVRHYPPSPQSRLDVSAEDSRAVHRGISHVLDKGGSAYGLRWRADLPELVRWLRQSNVRIGGKTGTAQVKRLTLKTGHETVADVPYKHRDHGWFVGFAPADRPEIVVAVLVEHGGWGSVSAAPIACKIIRAWHEGRNAVSVEKPKNSHLRSRDAINRVSTTTKRTKMDSCFRRNDRVGKTTSELSANADSAERHALLLSFLRKQESTVEEEKATGTQSP